MNILVTGAAGFIGFHLCQQLLARNHQVVGVDNLNDYYDVQLKKDRLKQINSTNFTFQQLDISDKSSIESLFSQHSFDVVVNLAAQAGVRYSLKNPHQYIDSNVVGFMNILEAARHHNIKHLVFASSSSVYGANTQQPFCEQHAVDHPVSLYAASKKANEMMAHSYASLYQLPCTGLRYFTVYGPWGRPDMALFKFTKKIVNNEPLDVYNHGEMFRDFTYIDDIIDGTIKVIEQPANKDQHWNSQQPNPATSYAPYRIYNIGRGKPVKLLNFIKALEKVLNKPATLNLLPLQAGEVISTHADTSALTNDFNYQPTTSLETGIKQFVQWYLDYYQ